MTAAPTGAATAWNAIMTLVAHAFSRPGFAVFVDLACGWVLTPGRRTVTRIIGVIDPEGRRAHDAYHRLLRDGVWQMDQLWRSLTVVIVARCVAPDAAVVVDLDDTVFHKTGRRIDGAGSFRDAVRSTRNRVVYTLGLNVVVLSVRVTPVWGGMPIGLPVIARIRRKDGDATTADLARDMLAQLAGWLPDRTFEVACDGAYATLCGAGLARVHITSRLRRDAAVYELTPPRTGKRGRPRKKGQRLPAVAALAAAATGWTVVTYDQRGTSVVRHIWSRTLLWYHVCGNTAVRLVVVRDPTGRQPDDFFVTTNTEVVFRDTKQHLGGQDPQCWKRQGPQRVCYLSLWLSSAIWLWYLDVWGARPSWRATPWYPHKTRPSFADALAALRRALWSQRITALWPAEPLPPKIRDDLVHVLATAA